MTGAGAIVNRKAEHLGTTDRGVVLFRRMLAHAIHTTIVGEQPELPKRYPAGTPTRTFAYELVLRLPDSSALGSREALAEFGKRASQVFIDLEAFPVSQRNALAETRVRQVLKECCAAEAARNDSAEVKA